MPDHEVNLTALKELASSLASELAREQAVRSDVVHVLSSALDTIWIFACGVEILGMQLGFAMLEAGMVRERNVVATYLKNVIDFLLNILAAVLGSFSLAYPDAPGYLLFTEPTEAHHWLREQFFFHLLFQGTAATIASGAMAERITIHAYMAYSIFISGVLFPLAVRITWGGGFLVSEEFLSVPFTDFAGCGVVHMVGGVAALVGCLFLGPRRGRYEAGKESDFQPHNLALVLTGTFLLWCAWYGFNAGSNQALSSLSDASLVSVAFISTTLSAASAGLLTAVTSLAWTRGASVEVLRLVSGILGGLVAITGVCDSVSARDAIVVGVIAAPLVYGCSLLLRRCGIDDVCDAIAVHGAGGCWGLLAVGLFHATHGLLTSGSAELLKSQLLGTAVLAAGSALLSGLYLFCLRAFFELRPDLVEEAVGLDDRLGFQAYAQQSAEAKEYNDLVSILEIFGHNPAEAAEALLALKSAPVLTFSPQASDGILQGEIEDIVRSLNMSNIHSEDWEFFAFLSHHKKDGGEVARLLHDRLRQVLLQASPLSNTQFSTPVVDRFPPSHYIFLDSNNLRDLGSLLVKVESSMNFVLLLTRSVLRRPWCIAELTRAVMKGTRIVCILVEWPDKQNDQRFFNHPQAIDAAIRWVSRDLISAHSNSSGQRSPRMLSPRLPKLPFEPRWRRGRLGGDNVGTYCSAGPRFGSETGSAASDRKPFASEPAIPGGKLFASEKPEEAKDPGPLRDAAATAESSGRPAEASLRQEQLHEVVLDLDLCATFDPKDPGSFIDAAATALGDFIPQVSPRKEQLHEANAPQRVMVKL
mmetsp:Transcript_63088/g.150372  ORF Transcript_63088/g.150372 Transcript_63088/m.150372 type:complete len:813 (+) Transcript_63088:14-2452(+)